MNLEEKLRAFNEPLARMQYPWWYRPSRLLLLASLPTVVIFTFSDTSMTLSKAQLFYSMRDMWVGIAAILILALGASIGEANWFHQMLFRRREQKQSTLARASRSQPPLRLAEALFSERFDWVVMAVFLVSHLIFFRNFFLSPGLAAEVLGGNLELKHTFKTIPGVTTWTQVSLVLGALRGLRWSGILPGKVKLISVFHLLFFGTLFVRAVLWSERLALIEGGIPFFIAALPRLYTMAGPKLRLLIKLLPVLLPALLLLIFTAFESLRSWQYYSAQHSSVFEFGWRRLYTYYFEAMNTGAATLGLSGFYDGPTGLMSLKHYYDVIYDGLYQGALDKEYNNTGGIWFIATISGNLFFIPFFAFLGIWHGLTWRFFIRGRLFGLFFPMTFLGLMEIIRIPYWFAITRVLASTFFIFLFLAWAITLHRRIRPARSSAPEPTPAVRGTYRTYPA